MARPDPGQAGLDEEEKRLIMRVGSHPLKKTDRLEPPNEVTICMVTFIPFLSGYFEQSLEVLRASLESIWQHTEKPYDLMIFDNGSCAEVRRYLLEQQERGLVQYLFLSDKNVGIPGAWNALFSAAPGKIIAYSDSDVYFYPGWLAEHRRILETYPNVGMITGIPLRSPEIYSSFTLDWAEKNPQVAVTSGLLQGWDIFWAHLRSLGIEEGEARPKYEQGRDVRFDYLGVPAYLGAGHFQFVAYKAALNAAMPFPYITPMGNERYLDETINRLGYLRLSLTRMAVRHLGNRLLPEFVPQSEAQSAAQAGAAQPGKRAWLYRLLDLPPLRRVLLAIYHRIFRLYYNRS